MKRVYGALVACAAMLLAAAPATAQVPQVQAGPEQLHVTLADSPDALVVHWAIVGLPYQTSETPAVEWSVDGGDTTVTEAAQVGTIRATGSVIDQTTSLPTTVYAATIAPIPPGAQVTYRAGETSRGFSSQRSVLMPPALNDTLTFVAYGDIGVDSTGPDGGRRPGATEFPAFDVRDLALSLEPDLVVIPGDLAYTNSQQGWNSFMRFMDPLQSTIVTMPVIGNHEWHDAQGFGYSQYLNEYVLPNDEHSYLFRAGPVTFIGLNSDTICTLEGNAVSGSPPRPCGDNGQLNATTMQFLSAALDEAEADATPWTIVYFHHPALSFGRHGSNWAVLSHWAPLFEQHGVDLVITAHDHLYSRSYPALNQMPVVAAGTHDYDKGAAPIYAVVGGGGRSLYQMPEEEPPAWHAYGTETHHLARIQVNLTSLQYQALYAANGTAFDAFTITQRALGDDGQGSDVPALPLIIVVAALLAAATWYRRHR